MRDDDYHPHYPDRQRDYFLRLMNSAAKFADHRRLAFFDYVNWEIVDGHARRKDERRIEPPAPDRQAIEGR